MHFVLISVLCSVTVAVMLKSARLHNVDTRQIIVWNYPSAVLLTYLIFQPKLSTIPYADLPYLLYVPIAILLPTLFVVLARSIRYAGLVHTEVAQRMSLLISLVAAIWLFHERFDVGRSVGIAIGVVAIFFLIGWQKGNGEERSLGGVVFPLLVFVGYGGVDVLFKQVALDRIIPYTTAMFLLFSGAFLVSILYLVYLLKIKRVKYSPKAMVLGLMLGGFNFGNILFYMKAHQVLSDSPSIVFTGMNIGVISLGTLIGVAFFQEKLPFYNKIGIFLAIISVLTIAYL